MGSIGKRAQSTPNAALIGELAGEYRIVRWLGAGGFGTVYEAEHPVLQRRAAVKVLHESRSLDESGVKRFVAEARAASQIRHRNIVDIFSFGTLPNGQLFYAMDLLDGMALDVYQRVRAPVPPEEALALLAPVAEALDALHAAGVIHRDVKPGNIFLAWDAGDEVIPKLLDFGLVKLLGNSPVTTASDVLMGTPYYMAPEQCRGEAVDARTDVYALGVICHELCTGRVPFTGDSATAVLVDHVQTPPPRMTEVLPGLPAELDAPVLAMLAKQPADRPPTAGAALQRLETAARAAGRPPMSPLRLSRPEVPAPSPQPASRPTGSPSVGGDGPPAAASGVQPTRRASALAWGALALGVAGGGVLVARLDPTAPAPAVDSGSAVAPEHGLGSGPSAGLPRLAEPGAPEPRPPTVPPPGASDENQRRAVASQPPVKPRAATGQANTVQVTLPGAPAGTHVSQDGVTIGSAAEPIVLEYGLEAVTITLAAPGHAPKTLRFVPNGDLTLDGRLRASPPRPAKAPKRRTLSRDLESPF